MLKTGDNTVPGEESLRGKTQQKENAENVSRRTVRNANEERRKTKELVNSKSARTLKDAELRRVY